MKYIVKLKFGSHLYGTNTQNSDTDFKGVYLPSLESCVIGNVPKSITSNSNNSNSKNTKEDVDCEIYSLQYFLLTLGKNGDTVFLDMIHAPDTALVESSDHWNFIRDNRSKFYTKNLKSYIGYCRTQVAKYGIKGSKLSEAERLINWFNTVDPSTKISEIYDNVIENDYIKKYNIEDCKDQDNRTIDFCGKKIMANTKIEFAIQMLNNFRKSYGARAEAAKNNSGIDWKAVSHAFRAGYQLKELYINGDIIFPLVNAEYLKDIKLGKFHFLNDNIGEKLDHLVSEVTDLANKSKYPESVDLDFWENWIISLYKT